MQLAFTKIIENPESSWPVQALNELEIARIEFNSQPVKTVSLQATYIGQNLLYRVIEEEDGKPLVVHDRMVSNGVLINEAITDYFLSVWPLAEILHHIFNGSLNDGLSHFRARSDYYCDFDKMCRQRVLQYFTESTPP